MGKRKKPLGRRLLRWLRNLILFFFVSTIFMVVLYRFVPVYYTPLMFQRTFEQVINKKPVKLKHQWVALEKISQHLPTAVAASEDNLFVDHNGFDFKQIQKAKEEAKTGGRVRGASTISQQTAKNVFLLPVKSYIRKGFEVYFTVLIELVWSKERIMEVYLNSIEMGDGIYGAEAVAKDHFGKSAYQLSKSEAALIAASLPNPIRFNSGKPSPYMLRRQVAILNLMPKLKPLEMGYGAKKTNEKKNTVKPKAKAKQKKKS